MPSPPPCAPGTPPPRRRWATHVERRPFGFYQCHAAAPGGQVTVRDLRPEQAPALVADLRAAFDGPVRVMVDDRATDEAIGAALVAAGCVRRGATTYLAHVGPAPAIPTVPGVSVEPVAGAGVPFRNRGIARLLLCRVLAEGYGQGCRSVIISTDPEDTPIQLYHRLGFTDEVYRRRQYELAAQQR